MGKVIQIEIKIKLIIFKTTKSILKIWFKLTKKRQNIVQIYDIYYIGYITIKKDGDCENIYSVNPLYLIIGKVDGYIECNSTECKFPEEKNKRKYLVFGSTDENKEVFKKDTELWDGIKNETETITGGKNGEYGKDFMKITFNTDDNFPLNKPLKLQLLTIIVTCIFEEDGKFYPQFYLDDCLYELRVANNL